MSWENDLNLNAKKRKTLCAARTWKKQKEISFNKYFYQHKPLRSIEEVSREILALEEENKGLIMDILFPCLN